MKNACIQESDLPVVSALPESSAARRHLAGCARCRARLAAFSAFVEPTVPAEGAREDEADRVLATILDREIFGTASRAAAAPRSGESSGAGYGAMLRLLWRPAFRPIWAVGLLLLAVVGVLEIRQTGDGPIVLREDRDTPASSIDPAAPVWTADGRIELAWAGCPGADSYVVAIFGEDLEEIGRVVAGAELRCLLPEETAARLRTESPLFWRVFALRGGDRIASSRMEPLKLPRSR